MTLRESGETENRWIRINYKYYSDKKAAATGIDILLQLPFLCVTVKINHLLCRWREDL